MFNTLKNIFKNVLIMLPLHVSVHINDHLQGAREQYFMQLLSWIPLMYIRCVFVQ